MKPLSWVQLFLFLFIIFLLGYESIKKQKMPGITLNIVADKTVEKVIFVGFLFAIPFFLEIFSLDNKPLLQKIITASTWVAAFSATFGIKLIYKPKLTQSGIITRQGHFNWATIKSWYWAGKEANILTLNQIGLFNRTFTTSFAINTDQKELVNVYLREYIGEKEIRPNIA